MSAQLQPGAQSDLATAPVRESVAWAAVFLLVLMSIVALLDRQIVALMVEMIKARFRVTDSQIGLMQGAAFSLVYAAATIPFGYAADRGSRRLALFVGVFFWAVAACVSGLAGSFNVLLAARIGVGFGEAALNPVVTSLLSDLFPDHRRAFAFSVVSIGSLIGVNGALVIGGAVLHWAGHGLTWPLLGPLAPWQVAFILTGAPGLLLAFAVFLMPEPVRRTKPAAAGPSAGRAETAEYVRQNGRFLTGYLGGFTCLGVASYGLMTWTPAVLQRLYGWSAAQSGLIAGSLIAACGIVGTLTTGFLVDLLYQRGRRDAHAMVYVAACLLFVACGGACAFARSAWGFLLIILPTKLVSNYAGIALAGISLRSPEHLRGRMAALFSLVTVPTGAAIGPSAVAFLTDEVFKDPAKVQLSIAVTMMLFSTLGAALLWLAREPADQPGALAASRTARPDRVSSPS